MGATGNTLVDGNNFIRHHLKHNKLFAAGKIGVTEAKILYSYFAHKKPEEHSFNEGYVNSGIFPKTLETFQSFCTTYLDSIKCLDLAPRWCKCLEIFEIELYNQLNPKCYNTPLPDLEPYYYDNPWTEFLKDKTVLVVSPFAKSIEQQFPKLEKIWKGKITNNFNLKTIKFPFSIGISSEMEQWGSYSNCLNHFKDEISKAEFDFCIIGAGAYSLPLCQHVKALGKSSIHLGGPTQILFGIMGKRWTDNKGIAKYVNDSWVTPLPEEMPTRREINEGACYW